MHVLWRLPVENENVLLKYIACIHFYLFALRKINLQGFLSWQYCSSNTDIISKVKPIIYLIEREELVSFSDWVKFYFCENFIQNF